MKIQFELNGEALNALNLYIAQTPALDNPNEAAQRLVIKTLINDGFLAPTPENGTTPDRLNSSNDD